MSHAVTVKTQIKNIKSLTKAFAKKGWTSLLQNSKARMYSTDVAGQKTYDYVAVNPAGKFDVGITVDSEGLASLVWDPWDQSLERQLGKNLKDVKQGYALEELRRFAMDEELTCEVEELANGQLKVIARA